MSTSERHIQTTITPEDFLRLKSLCIVQGQSLKLTMRNAILHYLNNNNNTLEKGEVTWQQRNSENG